MVVHLHATNGRYKKEMMRRGQFLSIKLLHLIIFIIAGWNVLPKQRRDCFQCSETWYRTDPMAMQSHGSAQRPRHPGHRLRRSQTHLERDWRAVLSPYQRNRYQYCHWGPRLFETENIKKDRKNMRTCSALTTYNCVEIPKPITHLGIHHHTGCRNFRCRRWPGGLETSSTLQREARSSQIEKCSPAK